MGSFALGSPSIPILQQDLITNIKGYYPGRIAGYVAGRAPVVNNVAVDLWEGVGNYVFPAAALQMSIASNSGADSFGIGIGAWEVHIHALGINGDIKIIPCRVNGVGATLLNDPDVYRINGMHIISAGASRAAVGNITLSAGGIVYAIITAGNTVARQAIYTVPAGYVGYISHWQASSGSSGNHFCETELVATSHAGVLYPGIFLHQDSAGTQNGGAEVNFEVVQMIPAMSDVKLTAKSDATNANVIALGAIMGWFEKI